MTGAGCASGEAEAVLSRQRLEEHMEGIEQTVAARRRPLWMSIRPASTLARSNTRRSRSAGQRLADSMVEADLTVGSPVKIALGLSASNGEDHS